MNIKEKLIEMFEDADFIQVTKTDNGYELEVSDMYESPEITFKDMMALSEIFGTTAIDIDNVIGWGGCDSCGYGGKHGRSIQIDEVTKNENFLIENLDTPLLNGR